MVRENIPGQLKTINETEINLENLISQTSVAVEKNRKSLKDLEEVKKQLQLRISMNKSHMNSRTDTKSRKILAEAIEKDEALLDSIIYNIEELEKEISAQSRKLAGLQISFHNQMKGIFSGRHKDIPPNTVS